MFSETSAALTWLERTIIYFPVLLIISWAFPKFGPS